MTKQFTTKTLFAFVIAAFMSVTANAASYGVLGNLGIYLGTFSGNDSESTLFVDAGIDADVIAKIDTPATSNGSLSIFNTSLNEDSEIIAGEWAFTGSGIITHIVIKAGSNYSLFTFSDGLNTGFFDTSTLNDKALSHITAYSATPIPLPAAAWLLLSACAGLLGFGRQHS